ncbi:hypothetical protein ACFOVS_03060, partial [Rhizobium lemnae]
MRTSKLTASPLSIIKDVSTTRRSRAKSMARPWLPARRHNKLCLKENEPMNFVLTVTCPTARGIVAALSG